MPTHDNSQLALPVLQDKDVKEIKVYKSNGILQNKRQLAISRARYNQYGGQLRTDKNIFRWTKTWTT